MSGEFRKSVGRPATTNAGGGVAVDASPVGDQRLAQQIRAAWGKAEPTGQTDAKKLYYDDAKQALQAVASKQVELSAAPQIAHNLGLIADPLDVTARQAMETIQKAAKGERATVDEHKRIIQEAEAALVEMGIQESDEPLPKRESMSAEEWRTQAQKRREQIKKNAAEKSTGIKLIPARHTSPDALTGNGLNPPDQGAGKQEVDEAERNEDTTDTQRASDTFQTDNDNEPATDGHNAPSRHARIEALRHELAMEEMRAAAEEGLEGLIGRLRQAALTPQQISDLSVHLDEIEKNDLYSEGQLDSVSGLAGHSDEIDISEDDIEGYLRQAGNNA